MTDHLFSAKDIIAKLRLLADGLEEGRFQLLKVQEYARPELDENSKAIALDYDISLKVVAGPKEKDDEPPKDL